MTTQQQELIDQIRSQANECYDFARKHDDDFGQWEHMMSMIGGLCFLIQDLADSIRTP